MLMSNFNFSSLFWDICGISLSLGPNRNTKPWALVFFQDKEEFLAGIFQEFYLLFLCCQMDNLNSG